MYLFSPYEYCIFLTVAPLLCHMGQRHYCDSLLRHRTDYYPFLLERHEPHGVPVAHAATVVWCVLLLCVILFLVCDPIFEQLKILKLKQINIFQTWCFVHKSLHNLLPSQFRHFFTINNEIHLYNTITACKIHPIQHI